MGKIGDKIIIETKIGNGYEINFYINVNIIQLCWTREIENIRSWSCANNLNLNLKKSSEIVFVDSMRRRQILLPSLLEGIPRACSLNILGNRHFSVSEHVSCVIGKCAQTIQALRILRSHGLCNDALHRVYRSTVIGKLLYAVNAWWGFTSAADRQRIWKRSSNEAFDLASAQQTHLT